MIPDPHKREEIENKTKEWLDPDGNISVAKTQELIEILEDLDPTLSYYSFWMLCSYIRIFGISEASILFTAWFLKAFGLKIAILINSISFDPDTCWSNLQFKAGSIFEALDSYRRENKLLAIDLMNQLSPCNESLISPSQLEALCSITTPRTREGVEAVAYEFMLNQDFLIEVLNPTS